LCRRAAALLLLQASALLLVQADAASSGRPFQQTPAYIQAAFKLGQQRTAAVLPNTQWQSLGPDRTTREWAESIGATWTVDAGRVRGMLQVSRLCVLSVKWGTAQPMLLQAPHNSWQPTTHGSPACQVGVVAYNTAVHPIIACKGERLTVVVRQGPRPLPQNRTAEGVADLAWLGCCCTEPSRHDWPGSAAGSAANKQQVLPEGLQPLTRH